MRRDIQFETWIEHAEFDEQTNRWEISTHTGEQYSAQFLICALGSLSESMSEEGCLKKASDMLDVCVAFNRAIWYKIVCIESTKIGALFFSPRGFVYRAFR